VTATRKAEIQNIDIEHPREHGDVVIARMGGTATLRNRRAVEGNRWGIGILSRRFNPCAVIESDIELIHGIVQGEADHHLLHPRFTGKVPNRLIEAILTL